MITEDYVSFETAKLLKEKGFDEATYHDYDTNGLLWFNEVLAQYNQQGTGFACPTLQMAMKWLREVHNINISVVPHSYKEDKPFNYEFEYWDGIKYHTPYGEKYPTYHELFGRTWKKYEEACDTAIKYCLEHLIKYD